MATCKSCDGEGVIRTGIEESPTTQCCKCAGSGTEPRGQQCELGANCRCVEGDEPGCWNWIGKGGL